MLVQVSDRPPRFVMSDNVDVVRPRSDSGSGSRVVTQSGSDVKSDLAASDVAERVNNRLNQQLESILGDGMSGLQAGV